MWILCMIHSQIVATNCGSEKSSTKTTKKYRRRYIKWNIFRTRKINDTSRATAEYFDDGFESFNGNGTSTSDNEILSSPNTKYVSKCVGTEDLIKKGDIDKHKQHSFVRYRKIAKKNETNAKKDNQSKEPYNNYSSRKETVSNSSSEDLESNSDTDSRTTVLNIQSLVRFFSDFG